MRLADLNVFRIISKRLHHLYFEASAIDGDDSTVDTIAAPVGIVDAQNTYLLADSQTNI